MEATLRSLAIRTVRVAEKPELLVAALEAESDTQKGFMETFGFPCMEKLLIL